MFVKISASRFSIASPRKVFYVSEMTLRRQLFKYVTKRDDDRVHFRNCSIWLCDNIHYKRNVNNIKRKIRLKRISSDFSVSSSSSWRHRASEFKRFIGKTSQRTIFVSTVLDPYDVSTPITLSYATMFFKEVITRENCPYWIFASANHLWHFCFFLANFWHHFWKSNVLSLTIWCVDLFSKNIPTMKDGFGIHNNFVTSMKIQYRNFEINYNPDTMISGLSRLRRLSIMDCIEWQRTTESTTTMKDEWWTSHTDQWFVSIDGLLKSGIEKFWDVFITRIKMKIPMIFRDCTISRKSIPIRSLRDMTFTKQLTHKKIVKHMTNLSNLFNYNGQKRSEVMNSMLFVSIIKNVSSDTQKVFDVQHLCVFSTSGYNRFQNSSEVDGTDRTSRKRLSLCLSYHLCLTCYYM